MKPKIVFFDVDGTLYHEKSIPDSTREAIRKLHANGIRTAVCTGRNVIDGGKIAKELEIPQIVFFNGALAVVEDYEVFSYSFDPSELNRVKDYVRRLNVPVVFQTKEKTVSEAADHPIIAEILSPLGIYLPEFGVHEDHPVYQMNLYLEESHDRKILEAFPGIYLYRWHKKAIDLQRGGINKAVGVARMLEHFGYHPNEAIAFGDGGNDVEMLSFVGTGVAMGNAAAKAMEAADMVTDSVHDDGIWNALKKLNVI